MENSKGHDGTTSRTSCDFPAIGGVAGFPGMEKEKEAASAEADEPAASVEASTPFGDIEALQATLAGLASSEEKEAHLLERISELYGKLEEIRNESENGTGADDAPGDAKKEGPRVLLITRRLPFTLQRTDDGWRAEASVANKADQAMTNFAVLLQQREVLWVGLPENGSVGLEPGEHYSLREQLLKEHRYLAVFADAEREQASGGGASS